MYTKYYTYILLKITLKIFTSRLLKQIRVVPNALRKYSIAKQKQLRFLSLNNLIVLGKSDRSKAEISESRGIENVNSPETSGTQGQKKRKNKSIRTGIHNQETSKYSERKCFECWEKILGKTNEDGWIECVSCRSWLPEFCSPFKDKYDGCGRR
jgi:DNA-directed RNA polymerase subunit RPC12/RpoP